MKWSRLTLEDGSVLMLRLIPVRVLRCIDDWGPDNLPRYFVSHQTFFVVESAPDELQRHEDQLRCLARCQ